MIHIPLDSGCGESPNPHERGDEQKIQGTQLPARSHGHHLRVVLQERGKCQSGIFGLSKKRDLSTASLESLIKEYLTIYS